MSTDPWFDAAAAAAAVIPVSWRRDGDVLQGALDGRYGSYAITVATPRASVFLVRAVLGDSVPEEAVGRVELLCMDTNWRDPTSCTFFSRGAGGRVVSAASIPRREHGDVPAAATLENTIRRASCTPS